MEKSTEAWRFCVKENLRIDNEGNCGLETGR